VKQAAEAGQQKLHEEEEGIVPRGGNRERSAVHADRQWGKRELGDWERVRHQGGEVASGRKKGVFSSGKPARGRRAGVVRGGGGKEEKNNTPMR